MECKNWSALRVVFCAVATLVLSAASAQAQATRTWVSGVGDDANPCSRTAPCKTFAGAISKTAARGEINCLDPAGYGGVTITKSMAIKCAFTEGGVLSAGAGVNGIVVNALATDDIILEGLDLNGNGTAQNGLRVLQARSVRLLKSEIYGYHTGISFATSNLGARLLVVDSHLFDNRSAAIMIAPTGGSAFATINNNEIVGNQCGIVATDKLATTAIGNNCSTSTGAGGSATVGAFHNRIADHAASAAVGVFANGNAVIQLGDNEIVGNLNGIIAVNQSGGSGIFTYGDNHFAQNTNDGTADGSVPHR